MYYYMFFLIKDGIHAFLLFFKRGFTFITSYQIISYLSYVFKDMSNDVLYSFIRFYSLYGFFISNKDNHYIYIFQIETYITYYKS